MKRLRVYLSSTFEDLKDYRVAVFTALEKAGLDVARMEAYTAADERPLDLCLRDVAESDIYVGLFGWRYGYVPPAHHGNPYIKSITELEYRRAEGKNLRKLLFFAHPNTKASWPDRFTDEVTGEGDGGRKLDALRKELGTEKSASFFHTPDELATLVLAAIMRTGLSGRPYSVPPRPPEFVPRPQLMKELLESLIGAGATHTLVRGAPGFGKTTLALDAYHRTEVVNAFPDGMLWITLGENPDLATKLRKLYLEVTGNPPAIDGGDAIAQALAKELEGRHCLVVVDDVWRGEDLAPFLCLDGPRLLVTTRILNLIEQTRLTGWAEMLVGEMDAGEAAALLGRGLSPDNLSRDTLFKLADRLGCWALLIDLANARLLEEHKTRARLAECIERVTTILEGRGVLGFDRRNSKARNEAVARSVEVGLEFAEAMFAGLAAKAPEISIFPADMPIPVRALVDLWAMDELDVEEEVVRPLHNLSLLRWERERDEVRLHHMIRGVLEARLANAAPVHRRLVDAWHDPHHLPHDYAWRWFGWHCVRANEQARLRRLLLDFNWLQAKLAALGVPSLTADYDILPDDRELRLVQQALRLSADVIAQNPGQLAPQLHGRLLHQETPGISELLASAVNACKAVWLRPLCASLTRAAGPLVRTLRGHRSMVLDAAVTPDGRRVVSASADNTLIVWSLASGEAERVLIGHTRYACSVVVTPDGHRAISGSLDATVRVWDLEDGREVFVFREHTGPIAAIGVTPDSKRAISASDDGTLKVWDLVTGVHSCTLTGHIQDVTDVKVTSDGRYAVSASKDCTLSVWDLRLGTERHTLGTRNWHIGQKVAMPDGREARYFPDNGVLALWDVATRRTLQTFPGHVDRVYSVALTSDGRRAVSASSDKTLRVWDVESGAELHVLRGHTDQAAVVVTTPDGRRAISGSLDKTVRVWDLDTGESLATLVGHAFDVFFVAAIHGGSRVLSGSSDSTLKVWDAENGKELGTLRAHTEQVRALVLTPDSRRAISASNDGTLRVWDLDAVADQHAWHGHIGTVNAIAVTADGRLAVTAAGAQALSAKDNTIRVWDVAKTVELVTLEGHLESVRTIATTPDGRRAVSGADDHDLKVWNLDTGVEIATLRGHTGAVQDVRIVGAGQTVVSASWDHTLIVWDLKRATHRHTLTGHTEAVNKVAISVDGRMALSTSNDQTVRLWDLEAGTEVRSFLGHTASTFAIALTPDGTRVLSGGADGTVRVWSLVTGDELLVLRGHCGVVTDVKVSADGEFAVSASGGDGTLRVWELLTGALRRTLVGHAAYVTAVAIIEGGRAVSTSLDRTVRVWDLASGMLTVFIGESEIQSLAVAPDGTLVIGEQSGRVHFLRIER